MVGKAVTSKDIENRIKEYRDYKIFENHCNYLMKVYNSLDMDRYGDVIFLDERFRGFGKSTFINKLSLIAMSEGCKVIVIGHKGVEYYCDKFYDLSQISLLTPRGIPMDSLILVDEITHRQLVQLESMVYKNRIFGFGRDV
jgi:hypothetical protein